MAPDSDLKDVLFPFEPLMTERFNGAEDRYEYWKVWHRVTKRGKSGGVHHEPVLVDIWTERQIVAAKTVLPQAERFRRAFLRQFKPDSVTEAGFMERKYRDPKASN